MDSYQIFHKFLAVLLLHAFFDSIGIIIHIGIVNYFIKIIHSISYRFSIFMANF